MPPPSVTDELDREARKLVVALELLRRKVVDGAGHTITNAHRRPEDPPPEWAVARADPGRAGGVVAPRDDYSQTYTGPRVDADAVARTLGRAPAPRLPGDPGASGGVVAARPVPGPGDPTTFPDRTFRGPPAQAGPDPSPLPADAQRVKVVGHDGPPLPVTLAGAGAGPNPPPAAGPGAGPDKADKSAARSVGEMLRDLVKNSPFNPVPDADPRKHTTGQQLGGAAGQAVGGSVGKAIGGTLGGIAGSLVGKFAILLAPLAALSTILQSAGSGFSVFNTAIKVFAATLAPVLLPVFVLLATAVVAASDVIWRELYPKLGEFYRLILETGIPAIKQFVDGLLMAARVFNILYQADQRGRATARGVIQGKEADAVGGVLRMLPGGKTLGDLYDRGRQITAGVVGGKPGEAIAAAQQAVPEHPLKRLLDAYAGRADEPKPGTPAAPIDLSQLSPEKRASYLNPPAGRPDGKSDLGGVALKDVLASLRQSMGPKAAFGSIAQANKTATLAGLNQDNLERRLWERMVKSLETLEREAMKASQSPPRYGKPDGQ